MVWMVMTARMMGRYLFIQSCFVAHLESKQDRMKEKYV